MKLYKPRFIFALFAAILLCMVVYSACARKSRQTNIDFTISSFKERYILGEPVYLKFTVQNNGNNIDSVFDFDDGSLAFNAEITNDVSSPIPYGGTSTGIIYYTKINPGESKEMTSCVSALRGSRGSPLFGYFPKGKYTTRGVIKNVKYGIIKSNTIRYIIESPEGREEDAFNDFQYFVNYDTLFKKRTKTREDNIALTDKAVEFLYKYPNSAYTGSILAQSCYDRSFGKYKYDESMLTDIEFYISNNINSPVNRSLIYHALGLCEKLGGKNKEEDFLQKLSARCNNDIINKLIVQIKSARNEQH